MAWNTLHIFSYGETQLIGQDFNKKVPSADCPSVPLLATDIYSHKPQDNTASSDYQTINIFNNMFVDFIPKTGDSFRVQWSELYQNDLAEISAVVAEVEAYVTPTASNP